MSSNNSSNQSTSHCHVFIMQHGLHGTDADFVFLEQELLAKIPSWNTSTAANLRPQNSEQQQENDVESSSTSTSTSNSSNQNHNRNVFTLRIKATNGRTHDGIEILGRLNALEVLDYMVNHQKLHLKFETIFVSFIGHSLGGLINRNAIAWLFHEHKTHSLYNMSSSGSGSGSGSGCGAYSSSEIFQLFSPVRNRCRLTSFLTLTSPHLGSRRPGGTLFQSIWRRGVHTFLGSAVGKTGLELSLNDQIPMLVFPAATENSALSVPDSTTATGLNEQQANGTMIDFTNCNNTGNGNEELGGEKDTSSTTSTSSNSGHNSSRRHSRTRSNSGHGQQQQQATPTLLLNVKQQQQQQQQQSSFFTFGGSNASQLSSLLYLNHASILPPSPSSSSKRERRKSFLASSGSSNSSSGNNIGGSNSSGSDQSIMVTREKRKRRKSGFQAWRSQTMNLLDIMSQPHGVYMQVLQMFRFRTALAISHFDLSVPYSSASIRSFNPHAVPKFGKLPRFHIVGYSGFENEQYENELLAPRMLQVGDETMSSVSSVSSVTSLSNTCNTRDDNGGNVVAVDGGDVGDQSMTPIPTAVETTVAAAAAAEAVVVVESEDKERITTESVSSVSTNATQQTNGKHSQLVMDESIPMIEVPNGTTISTMTSVDDEDDNDDDCGAGSEREHKHIGVHVELEVSEQQQQQQQQQNQTETTTTETVTTIRRHLSFGELKGTEHEPFEGDDNMNGYFADNARQVEFSTQMLSNLQSVTWRRVDVEFTLQNTLQKHMVHIMPVRKSRSYPMPGGDLLDKVAAECITFEAQMLWMDHEIALREQQQQDK